jgi:hypothetical protein
MMLTVGFTPPSTCEDSSMRETGRKPSDRNKEDWLQWDDMESTSGEKLAPEDFEVDDGRARLMKWMVE